MLITLTAWMTGPPRLTRQQDTLKIDLGQLLIELGLLDFTWLIKSLTEQAKNLGIHTQ
jgi:hypothetical protein